ncbi:MAG: hypothetical protein KC586_16300, partial [Myxococcales bacterium]|nr:hypothetical protein [Myxococcales bacterium]
MNRDGASLPTSPVFALSFSPLIPTRGQKGWNLSLLLRLTDLGELLRLLHHELRLVLRSAPTRTRDQSLQLLPK